MAEASVSVEIVINRPIGDVFAIMSNYDNAVKWQGGVIESRQVSPGEPRAGAKISYTREIAGRRFETNATIERLDVDAAIRISSAGKLYSYDGGYDFETVSDDTTRVIYRGTIKTGRLLGPIGKKLAGGFESQMTGDLANLKRLLEAGDLT